jgi:hypothetical protein
MAPCMPIPGPAGSPGTPHQLMSVDENTARQLKNPHERPPEPPNYLLMGRPEITYHSRKSVAVAVKAGLGSAGENSPREELKQAKKIAKQRRKLNNQLENLKGEKNKQKRDEKKAELEELTKKEGELRSGAAAKLQRESAAQMAKDRAKAEGTEAKGPPSASDPQEVDALAQEVAKCVETFRQNGMKAMRAQIQQQYSGQNLQDIREKTKANKDQASKDFAIAKANKEKGIPDQETADREHKKAGRNFGEAIKEYNNVDCLAEQAKHLSEAPADITGRIPLLPPPKPKSTSGSQSTKKEK